MIKMKIEKLDIIWGILFFAVFLMLIYKCQFGFGNIDEAYYLAMPYRLVKGDSLLFDEWSIAQLSGFLEYPILKIYLFLFGTTKGIILAFRYIYTVLHAVVSIYVYICFRKVNEGAIIASLVYFLFAPFGIMALSYNSMGVSLVLVTGLLCYSNSGNKSYITIMAGISFAAAVLCCPYLLIMYFLYGVICAVLYLMSSQRTSRTVYIKQFAFFTVGCFFMAVLFFVFLLSRTSIKEITVSLPHILENPTHPSRNVIQIFMQYLRTLLDSDGNTLGKPVFFACTLLSILIFIDKKKKFYTAYFILAFALTGIYLFPFMYKVVYINYLMLPLNILGIFCFFLSDFKYIKEMIWLWIPGILYGFCLNCSSNQYFYVTCEAAAISTVGSILIIVSYCKDRLQEVDRSGNLDIKKIIWKGIPILLFGVFICSEVIIRYNSVFWEERMEQLTCKIEEGVESGIWTTEKKQKEYSQILEDTEYVRNYKAKTVLYYTPYTWLYLMDEKECGAFSPWIGENETYALKLENYYLINEGKEPDIIYCVKEGNYKKYLFSVIDTSKYIAKETELGYILIKTF